MEKQNATWGDLPDDVEIDDNDDVDEVDPPNIAELAAHLGDTLREFESGEMDLVEDVVSGEGS